MSRLSLRSITTVAASWLSTTFNAADSGYSPSDTSSATFRPSTSRRGTEKARSKAAFTRITTPWLSVTKNPSWELSTKISSSRSSPLVTSSSCMTQWECMDSWSRTTAPRRRPSTIQGWTLHTTWVPSMSMTWRPLPLTRSTQADRERVNSSKKVNSALSTSIFRC